MDNDKKQNAQQKNDVRIVHDDYLILRQNAFDIAVENVYSFLYLLGIAVLRRFSGYKRHIGKVLKLVPKFLSNIIMSIYKFVTRLFKEVWRTIKSPFEGIKRGYRNEKFNIETSVKNHTIPWSSVGRIAKEAARYIWSIFSTILNYAAPIVVFILLVSTINTEMSKTHVLHVTYKGKDLGYIESEHDFSNALSEVDDRLVSGLDSTFTSGTPYFQVVEKTKDIKITTENALINGIIRASSDDVVEVYGLYADDVLVGAVDDLDYVLDEIDKVKNASKTNKLNEIIEFDKSIRFDKGLFPLDTVITEKELLEKLNAVESVEESYTIQEGDTLDSIALNMGIKPETLVQLNPTLTEEGLVVGDEIIISKEKRYLSVKTIYTDIYEEPIPYSIKETPNALYARSYYKVESEGVDGVGLVTAEVTVVDGVTISSNKINVERLSEPVTEFVTVGVDVHPDKNEKGFMWPAAGGYIGTGLGGYPGHAGIDINGTGGIGSPVYASASGTVTKAVYSDVGYGNHIVIAHDGGFETYYAHCTSLYVAQGDNVAKGQQIATVGSSGRSTGPHLHFEVKLNKQVQNPTNYVSIGV